MIKTFNYILFPLLLMLLSFILFTSADNDKKPNSSSMNINAVPTDSFRLKGLYSFGKVPYPAGIPDSIQVRAISTIPNTKTKKIVVQVYNDSNVLCNPLISLNDSCFSGSPKEIQNADISNNGTFDTTLNFKLESFGIKMNDIIIVSAIIGDGAIFNSDFLKHCYKVSNDGWSLVDSCLSDTTGSVFSGRPGNIVAGFRNRSVSNIFLNSIDHTFLDSSGGGSKPYKMVVYADNGSGKPGSILHLSSALTSPAGTGTPQKVTYNLSSPITISAGNKFYVGLRQTTTSNIKAAFQKENPVRKKALFFTSPDTGSNWYDFSDSSKNLLLDVSPIIQYGQLNLTSLVEGFYNNVTNKMVKDTMRVYLRNNTSPFAIIDSAKAYLDSTGFARFFFSNVSSGTYYIQLKHRNSIVTWSKSGGESFTIGGTLNYNFTSAASQAFGNNMILKGSKYCIYSGDVNLDGTVDLTDLIIVYNDASLFASGYIVSDVNGDAVADLSDIIIVFNNSTNFVSEIAP